MVDFVKGHGLGNDYIVLDPAQLSFRLTSEAIRLICHRNLGVGSDGILVVRKSSGTADFAMTIHNPDGSDAEKSGNGIRIFAKYLFDRAHTNQRSFVIETPGGDVAVELELENGRVKRVAADMGRASFNDQLTSLKVDDEALSVVVLSLGNPHCVVVVDDPQIIDFYKLGPLIENHAAFPQRTNVQFVVVEGRKQIRIRIWERGAGETLASGSSSCAAAAACHRLGLVDEKVVVRMEGGDLEIAIAQDWSIRMEGPAEETFQGDFSPELLAHLEKLGA